MYKYIILKKFSSGLTVHYEKIMGCDNHHDAVKTRDILENDHPDSIFIVVEESKKELK